MEPTAGSSSSLKPPVSKGPQPQPLFYPPRGVEEGRETDSPQGAA